jgi:hypothetical protein
VAADAAPHVQPSPIAAGDGEVQLAHGRPHQGTVREHGGDRSHWLLLNLAPPTKQIS